MSEQRGPRDTWPDDPSYESGTRDFYKSRDVAEGYHDAFAGEEGSWRHARFRYVARREVAIVEGWLDELGAERVLDVPCGTGKLAPAFRRLGVAVCACDTSEDMLRIARRVFGQEGVEAVRFVQCDAEMLDEAVEERFDAFVCLRLLHRVPDDVRAAILEQLAGTAPRGILSMAVETPFHRVRRRVRRWVFGGGGAYNYPGWDELRRVVGEEFEILAVKPVARWLSQEVLLLVRPREEG